jgi:hypothetical protein
MKRWAILTVALYGLVLVVLTFPVLVVFLTDLVIPSEHGWDVSLSEVARFYREWGYWLWLGILLACQALLLLVPMDVARERQTPRRRLVVPVVVAGFLMAQLVFAGFFSLLALAFGDDGYKLIEFLARLTFERSAQDPVTGPALQQAGFRSDDTQAWAVIVGLLLTLWVIWGLVFSRFAQRVGAEGLMHRLVRWLLRGSILEFLVAVPSHIVARHRGDCCAPVATFWGIVTGLSLMLLAFGPAVFILFVRRFRQLRPPPRPGPEPGESQVESPGSRNGPTSSLG